MANDPSAGAGPDRRRHGGFSGWRKFRAQGIRGMSEDGTRLAQRQRVRGVGEECVAGADLHAIGVALDRDRVSGVGDEDGAGGHWGGVGRGGRGFKRRTRAKER